MNSSAKLFYLFSANNKTQQGLHLHYNLSHLSHVGDCLVVGIDGAVTPVGGEEMVQWDGFAPLPGTKALYLVREMAAERFMFLSVTLNMLETNHDRFS